MRFGADNCGKAKREEGAVRLGWAKAAGGVVVMVQNPGGKRGGVRVVGDGEEAVNGVVEKPKEVDNEAPTKRGCEKKDPAYGWRPAAVAVARALKTGVDEIVGAAEGVAGSGCVKAATEELDVKSMPGKKKKIISREKKNSSFRKT